jgi:hypothetical protein
VILATDCGWSAPIRTVRARKEVTMTSILGAAISSTVVPFGATALAAGAVLAGLLVATVAILVVAERVSAS